MDRSDALPLVIIATGLAIISYRNYRRSRLRKLDPAVRPSVWRIFYLNSPTLRLAKLRRLRMPWVTLSLSALLVAIFILENTMSDSLAFDRSLILTPETINWRSVTLAQFLHGGWSHLYNNVTTFILFGVIVENWMGSYLYLAVYLLGGYLGIFTYVKFMAPPGVIVLGASANISAVIGAYAVFRIAVWRPVYAELMGAGARAASLGPQVLFYLYFVFGDDLAGLKQRDAGIAFGAHLIGSTIGIGLAATFFKFSKTNRLTPSYFVIEVRGEIPQLTQ